MVASLWTEVEVKNTLCNTVRELLITLGEIREKGFNDDFIKEIKNEIKDKDQQISDAYSIFNEVVMYSDQVVLPAVLQKRILKEFHVGHPGMLRMKNLIRRFVCWTNMDRVIEYKVKTCKGCALAAKAPPIKLSLLPKTNWLLSRIHIDLLVHWMVSTTWL